jgi:hypothetical protein
MHMLVGHNRGARYSRQAHPNVLRISDWYMNAASRAGRPGKDQASRNSPLSRVLNRRAAGGLDVFDAVDATLGVSGGRPPKVGRQAVGNGAGLSSRQLKQATRVLCERTQRGYPARSASATRMQEEARQ